MSGTLGKPQKRRGPMTEEERRKRSLAAIGRKQSPEHRAKTAANNRARGIRQRESRTPEQIAQSAERLRAWYVAYYQRPDIKEMYRRRARERRKSPMGALHARIQRAVRAHLIGEKRRQKTFDLLGYSVETLSRHLERQFTRGMTWRLFFSGAIHVDHIIPASSFAFSTPQDEDFKACWALTNLRPMWAIDNIRKRNRRDLLL